MTALAHHSAHADGSASTWSARLRLLAIAAAAILALLWRDAAQMADIWWNSSTYNHCLLIAPILVWLVAQRRQELAWLTPVAWWPGLIWAAIAAAGWLLGDIADINFARHLALVMLLQAAVATLLGPNVTRGLTFPLFFAFFMVPFGDELIPPLQILTADMSMAMLGWSGIPAHLEGIFISTPTGLFRVAEACSGVKFLVAMVTLGALVANLCFTSWSRRAWFLAACVAVPILANGVRAWGTMVIAFYSGLDFAAGFDHIFYGWVFFGLVIALTLALGWPFFDKRADATAFDPATLQDGVSHKAPPRIALAALIAIAALPLAIAAILP